MSITTAIAVTMAREANGAVQYLHPEFLGEVPEGLEGDVAIVIQRAKKGAVSYTPPALIEYLENP